jgi:hypothetical protein
MKKRRIPAVERLEARETPDVSLSRSALPLPPPAKLLVSAGERGASSHSPPAAQAPEQAGVGLSTAEALLAEPSTPPKKAQFSRAVRTLFASAEEVDRLLASSATLPGPAPVPLVSQPLAFKPVESEAVQFLTNYTRKAIRNTEVRYGPIADHEDIVHQVFVEWRERVGQGEKVFGNLLNRDSSERQVLRKAVQRVIDHARYEQSRQGRMVEFQDQPAAVKPESQEWIDMQLDWSLGAGAPGPRERRLLELRRQGKTFAEIGSEMGMIKQRVCEVFNATVERLSQTYSQGKDRQRNKKAPLAGG